MAEEHANVTLLKRLDLRDLAANAEIFAPDVVFHYFNPKLPEVQGDYAGIAGIQTFFETTHPRLIGDTRLKLHPDTPINRKQ